MNKKVEYYPYYKKTFDELLIPEGFIRKNNTYYRIIKNTNCIQIFERAKSRSSISIDYCLFVIHTSFSEIIKEVNSDTYALGIRLGKLVNNQNIGFRRYDFKKLFAEKKSEEERVPEKQEMLYEHIDFVSNCMKTKGLEFFDYYNNIYTIRDLLLDIYIKYQGGSADRWLYLGDFERMKFLLKKSIIIDKEQIQGRQGFKKDISTKLTKAKSEKKQQELIEQLNFQNELIKMSEESILKDSIMLRMVEEKNKSELREQLKLADQTTRNSVAELLKQEMIPLDLDEWEHRVF